jgi:O-succinylbenzoic acid--CoA ligase
MSFFSAYYSNDFDDKLFVKEIIKKWNQGDNEFKIYTSGTTGKPKEITLTRKVLKWSAISTQNKLNLPRHKIMCCLSVQRTGGFMQLIRALIWQCEIQFFKPSNNPLGTIQQHDFTTISLTPAQFKSSLIKSPKQLNKFKHILIGGAPLNNSSSLTSKLDHPQIWLTYGMTETASHIAMQNLSNNETVLYPLPGVKISQNKTLQIHIPELDIQLQTNDIGEFREDGFVILGRSDNVINSGGIKIHPHQIEVVIESVFQMMNLKKQFYVSKENHPEYGEVPILIMEGKPDFNQKPFIKALTPLLPKYHAPKKIYFTPKILKTDTGKVIREAY